MSAIDAIQPCSLQHSLFPKRGDPRIRVAILDGPADLEHPCFRGADLTSLPSPNSIGEQPADAMVAHGTHVASVIFGQQDSEVEGLVPGCSGFVIPIFFKDGRTVSQLDLARAIELAVDKGAHVINVSGGQLTDVGEADVWLHNAIRLCGDRNVLVVAAGGNDGCECLHVPAALPNVLAVGALDRQEQPMDFSNWGYQTGGVMPPGEEILPARYGRDQLLGIAVPIDEVEQPAIALRNQTLFYSIAFLVFAVPIYATLIVFWIDRRLGRHHAPLHTIEDE
jgi:subtilisin family serine protease